MAQIIPVTPAGDRRLQVLLGVNLLTLRTYWNPTVPGWFMDIEDSAGNSVVRGLAMVISINLLGSSAELSRLLGEFWVVPLDGTENDREDSLGRTNQLWWFAPGEQSFDTSETSQAPLQYDIDAMYRVDL